MNETADLIALGDCVFLPVNAETTAVLNRSNGAMGFVSGDVARALKHCLCLHSAAHHAQVIAAHLPGLRGEESAVVDTLRALEKSELFLSSRQISDRLAHSTQPAALARTLLFVITCDRPRALKRLLDSLQDFTGLTRFEQLFVVDDSRSDENIAQNRDIGQRDCRKKNEAKLIPHFLLSHRTQLSGFRARQMVSLRPAGH